MMSKENEDIRHFWKMSGFQLRLAPFLADVKCSWVGRVERYRYCFTVGGA
jgi:hypothetical protein